MHQRHMCLMRNGEEYPKYKKIQNLKMNNNNVKVNLLESRFEQMSYEGNFKAIYI